MDTLRARGQVIVMAFEVEWSPDISWNTLTTILIIKPFASWQVPYYKFPGGMLHEGEDFRQAAPRELLEETGVVASSKPKNLIELSRFKKKRHPPHSGEFDVVFYAAYGSDFSGLKDPLLGKVGDEGEESLKVRFSDIAKPKHRWSIQTKPSTTASMFRHHHKLLKIADRNLTRGGH